MAQLSVGAWAWDGAAAEWFLLRAHVAWVSADQPGSAKLSKMTGVTGRMGCRFCMIQGCYGKPAGAQDDDDSEDEEPPAEDLPERWARTPYFPLSTPTAVASLGPNRTRLPSYDPEALPLRTEDEYWDFLDELDGNVDEREFSRRTGISARPLLAALPSFVHPHFFPSDIFHLFTFNTLQLIWDTISLFKPGDPFNFAPRLRRKFGLAVVDAGSHLPGAFGSKPRNPHTKHNSHFKMVEWMATFHFYLGPYLQDAGAPTELLDMIVAILDGISFASQSHGCRFVEVHAVRRSFITFVTEWERLYIRNDDALLSRARLSIHLLLHIADQIAATGNPRATSQAACERQIGLIKGELRSFRDPYEALVRRTHLIEQVNALDLLLDPQDGVATRRDRQWLDHPDRPDGIRPGRSISLAKAKSICHRRTSLHAIRTALFAEGYNLKRDARLHGFARFTRSSFTFAVRSHLGRTSRTRRFSSVVAWSASPDHDLEYFDVLAFAIKTEEMVAVGRRFVVDCDRSRSSNHWVAGQWSPRLQVISVDGIHDIMGVFPIEATTYLFPRKNSFGGFAQWWAERCIASAETSEDDE
ncbi:hypothetical protein OC835_007670 [Tilletia horrida]|nr:hypothetical protein OC835_007670 [Tilletia horrida]